MKLSYLSYVAGILNYLINLEENMKKTLSNSLKHFFGLGNFGFQVMMNIEAAFFPIFLTDTVRFPIYTVGIIMIVTSIVDFILAPLSGFLISATKPMRWGRIRSWLLISPPLIIIFYLMQFSNLGIGAFSVIIITTGYIFSHALWNTAFTADVAIIAEIAPSHEERLLLGSRRMMFSNLGRMLSSFFTPLFLIFFTDRFGNENTAYLMLILCATIIMCFCFWSDFKITERYEERPPIPYQKADMIKRLSIKEIISSLHKNPSLFAIMVADLSSNVGSFLLPTLATYYYKYVVCDMNILKYHLFLVAFGGLIGAYFSGYLFKKIYKKKVLIFIYFMISLLLLISRVFAYHTYIFIGIQMLMQFFVGISQPMEADLYMDIATYYEWKNRKNATGFIMGLMNIPGKLSIVLKGIILTITLLAVEYMPEVEPTLGLKRGIANAYLIPAIIPLIGIISLKFLFILDDKSIEKMENEIDKRKINAGLFSD